MSMTMASIYLSRYTPGLDNGEEVSFKIGEAVDYLLLNGKSVKATILSEIMEHQQAPGDHTGYECRFHDDGSIAFAARCRIIGWEGKV